MNTRTFGVEIECGYYGNTAPESPECICVFDEETEEWVDPEDEHCASCCGCWYADEGGRGGCDVARRLLIDHGFDHWTGSIHPDGSGVEIPSPVLRGREGLKELRCVMELLSSHGFRAGSEDGFHVHHGAQEWREDASLVAHTIELWEENDDLIRQFVGRDRRCTTWARSRKNYPSESNWEEFKRTKDVTFVNPTRYYALNVNGVVSANAHSRGTIELRLHEGTLDFAKAAAWIKFGQRFLEFAKLTHSRGEIVTCASRTDLLNKVVVPSTTRRQLMLAGRSAA